MDFTGQFHHMADEYDKEADNKHRYLYRDRHVPWREIKQRKQRAGQRPLQHGNEVRGNQHKAQSTDEKNSLGREDDALSEEAKQAMQEQEGAKEYQGAH